MHGPSLAIVRKREDDGRSLECPITQLGKCWSSKLLLLCTGWRPIDLCLFNFEIYKIETLTWLLEFPRFYQLHILVLFYYEVEIFFVQVPHFSK